MKTNGPIKGDQIPFALVWVSTDLNLICTCLFNFLLTVQFLNNSIAYYLESAGIEISGTYPEVMGNSEIKFLNQSASVHVVSKAISLASMVLLEFTACLLEPQDIAVSPNVKRLLVVEFTSLEFLSQFASLHLSITSRYWN